MKCTKCQFENPEDSKFCLKCGAKQEVRCPECGQALPAYASFCNECGHDLRKRRETPPIDYSRPQSYTPKYLAEKILTTRSSIEGERKLVTVLFADVANYTSIAEKLDPEEAHQILDGCFKILMDEIHRYEGTINQFTGDGVMALFGAPLAHEDHAQRACHAALAIQKSIGGYGEKIRLPHGAEFKMRIGMNSGPVVVGRIGDDLRMDYTAVGDTTNLAHRLQVMASPGSTLVSTHTHRLTRDFFEFVFLGKVEVKGKEQPQEAYKLIKSRAIETRIGAAAAKGLTRFVGRRREMEALREAFDKAQSGSGQVIGIVGEAGVGKSRLILELKNTLPECQYSFLEGRCLHYGSQMPYLPILDMLREYFEIEEGDREAAIKRKLREKLRQVDEKTDVVPPALHELLSLKVEDDKYPQLGPQQRRERTFEAIRHVLIRESQRNPLILVVEDLHWIDRTSQEFLDYLIGSLPTARILLVLLYRPEFTHTWGSKSYYSGIGVDQLSAQRSAELVQAILEGGDVAPEIAGLVLSKAGGNPLFVEELTHSLLENGSIQREDDQFVLTRKASDIEVPDTIHGIIAARMDRIEENLKRIMQVASVIGREFAYRILQAITGMSEELKSSLLNLQGLEFIYEKQLFPELEYIFKHALTQEVAYNSLLLKRRKEIHERIGKAIEELYGERLEEYYEILAYHYVRSDNKDKAVEYLDLANQKTAKIHAMQEAKELFKHAVDLLSTLPETTENLEKRLSLVVNQLYVYEQLIQMPEYFDILAHHEGLSTKVRNPRLLGAFYVRLAYREWTLGNLSDSIRIGTRAANMCEAARNPVEAGLVYGVIAYDYFFMGEFQDVFVMRDKIFQKMEEGFLLHAYERSLHVSVLALSWLGRWGEALEHGQRALRIAQEYSDGHHLSHTAYCMALCHTFIGDIAGAINYAEMAIEKGPTPFDKTLGTAALAWAWSRAGEHKKAVEAISDIVLVFRAGKYATIECFYGLVLAEAYLSAGDYEKAEQSAGEYLKLAERCGSRICVALGYRLLGEVALIINSEEAPPHFEQSISIFREIKAENDLALAYSGMGRYHKLRGEYAEARRYLTQALEIFERLGTLIEPDKVRKELAELPV